MSFPIRQASFQRCSNQTPSNLLRFGSDQQWLEDIKTALLDNRFCLYLREVNALATLDSQRAYDVLLFLITQDGQKIPAEVFQPVAERYGFSAELNHWMIENFINSLSQVSVKFIDNYRFTIPLSTVSIKDYRWLEMIDDSLTKLGISKDIIGFELSEKIALSDLALTSELMTHLQTLGYCFTLDDCGGRMASFSYLKYLPVDYLKISDKFVRTMHQDATDKAIVELIHYLAQVMGLQTIAKGVDNLEILKAVMSLGVDYAQGRYLADFQLLDLKQLR